ncbi:unnamed protein product [Pedinophyceae sp. YPF-701]|nr:unnamed protein product [Pedinophyceae sp. YPF-701]
MVLSTQKDFPDPQWVRHDVATGTLIVSRPYGRVVYGCHGFMLAPAGEAPSAPDAVDMGEFEVRPISEDDLSLIVRVGKGLFRAFCSSLMQFVGVRFVDTGSVSHDRRRLIGELVLQMEDPAPAGIVPVHGVFRARAENRVAVVFPYVRGGTLGDLLASVQGGDEEGDVATIDPNVLSTVAADVLEGLAFLHAKGNAHLSIDPSKILLSQDEGAAYLSGTGLIERMDAERPRRGMPTTYSPPEIVGSAAAVLPQGAGAAADVWALGVCLAECAVGCNPIADSVGQDLPFAVCHRPIALPEESFEACPDLRDFIVRCLERHPQRRPSAADLLNHPFVAGRHGASPEASRDLLRAYVRRYGPQSGPFTGLEATLVVSTLYSVVFGSDAAAGMQLGSHMYAEAAPISVDGRRAPATPQGRDVGLQALRAARAAPADMRWEIVACHVTPVVETKDGEDAGEEHAGLYSVVTRSTLVRKPTLGGNSASYHKGMVASCIEDRFVVDASRVAGTDPTLGTTILEHDSRRVPM